VRRYRQRDAEKALNELQSHTSLALGDERNDLDRVEDRDPKTAAAMAKRVHRGA